MYGGRGKPYDNGEPHGRTGRDVGGVVEAGRDEPGDGTCADGPGRQHQVVPGERHDERGGRHGRELPGDIRRRGRQHEGGHIYGVCDADGQRLPVGTAGGDIDDNGLQGEGAERERVPRMRECAGRPGDNGDVEPGRSGELHMVRGQDESTDADLCEPVVCTGSPGRGRIRCDVHG